MSDKRKKHRTISRDVRGRGTDQVFDESTPYNPHLKAAIMEVVENQLRDGDPPETRQTLERLLAEGYSQQQATEMIGSVVISEIWTILHDNKQFDRPRFIAALKQLG